MIGGGGGGSGGWIGQGEGGGGALGSRYNILKGGEIHEHVGYHNRSSSDLGRSLALDCNHRTKELDKHEENVVFRIQTQYPFR